MTTLRIAKQETLENPEMYIIELTGNTYQHKDDIKALGYQYNGDGGWYWLTSAEDFKAKAYTLVRKTSSILGLKASDIIIHKTAENAVATMNK